MPVPANPPSIMFSVARQGMNSALRSAGSVRALSSKAIPLSEYAPSLAQAREGEAGPGGRSSNKMLKVAIFGGSGFLGKYVAAELGTWNCVGKRRLSTKGISPLDLHLD